MVLPATQKHTAHARVFVLLKQSLALLVSKGIRLKMKSTCVLLQWKQKQDSHFASLLSLENSTVMSHTSQSLINFFHVDKYGVFWVSLVHSDDLFYPLWAPSFTHSHALHICPVKGRGYEHGDKERKNVAEIANYAESAGEAEKHELV